MKKHITLFVLFISSFFYAQTSGINYQAVIYNPSPELLPGYSQTNAPLVNRNICLRFSIIDATAVLEYQETIKTTTDEFGMVNVTIGTGTPIGGNATLFEDIVWDSSTKKLKVDMDVNGNCTTFLEISNQPFTAVPFAYASKTAENVTGIVAIANGGTGSNTVAGAKINLGLNNVDNTSDLNKPLSIAVQTALNLKENTVNKSDNVNLGTSTILFPTQNAVKVYVDSKINSGGADLALEVARATTAETTLTTNLAAEVTRATTTENTVTTNLTTEINNRILAVNGLITDLNAEITRATVAENTKENIANKSVDTNLGTSNILFPTQNAVKTYVDNQLASSTPDATTSIKGKIKLAGDLAGTADLPIVQNNAITSAKIANTTIVNEDIANATITSAKIDGAISLVNGGTGSDLSNSSGYIKQVTTGGNFTTVFPIPAEEVSGAVRFVNGSPPDQNTGNVSVPFGYVTTGLFSSRPAISTTNNGDIFVISGETGANASDNGRTYISTGSTGTWNEVTSNQAATDARYVQLAGSTMLGSLAFPTGTKVTLADAPTTSSDVTNKAYVDGRITTINNALTAEVTRATNVENLKQDISNKSTDGAFTSSNVNDTKYPTTQAVKTYIDSNALTINTALTNEVIRATNAENLKQDISNKSTDGTFTSSNVNDTKYPTTQAVKTYVDTKMSATNAIANLTSLPNISDNTILGNTTGASTTPKEIPVTGSGNIVLGSSASINTPTITSPVLNGTITGSAIVSVAQGGSGANMSTTAGYLKQEAQGANFTTVTSIPLNDVAGAVHKVNGVGPAADGNITVVLGKVTTGNNSAPTVAGTPVNSDIYVVAGQTTTPNDNGRTYIYDGLHWNEVATNISTTDNRYVRLTGSNMAGDLNFPAGNKITIVSPPNGGTDVTNKTYVDNLVASGTTDATTTATGKMQLAGDLTGVANAPQIGTNKVTFAKMQNLSAQSKLLGTPSTGGLGVSEITLGTGLTMTNGTLNATGGTVTNTTGTIDRITLTNGSTTPSIDIASTYAGQSSITTLGTITTGTWNGTTISVPNGGTGTTILTGYVKGNGTNAMTAITSIPVADISGAQTTANLSANIATNTGSTIMYPSVDAVETALALKASLASPTFTGVPTAPTAPVGTNTTQIATTAFVAAASGTPFYKTGTTTDILSEKTTNFYTNKNVGIGTNNPVFPLDVVGGLSLRSTVGAMGTGYGMEFLTNASAPRIDWVANGAYIGQFSSDNNDFFLRNSKDNTGNIRFWTKTATVGKERMTILNNGNVGIGTTTPATYLHLQGPTAVQGDNATAQMFRMSRPSQSGVKWDNIAQFNLGAYTSALGSPIDAKSRLDLALTNGADNTTLTNAMTWLGNGNVGIGTTTPSAPLVVQGVVGTGALKLIAPSVASGDNWWMGFGHGAISTDANDRARVGVNIVSGGSGRLFFTTGAPGAQTTALFIDESQRVGIGTSAPVSKFEVNGSATNTAAFNSGSATAILFNNSNLAYTSASPTSFNLQGMKDGGTYTLAVQGTTQGTASFIGLNPSGTAFTFLSANNGLTIAGKQTLYTFIVMGTSVYYYMEAGF